MIGKWISWAVAGLLLAALPASGSYQLNSYGFGTGGSAGTSSTNYSINGIAGEGAGQSSSTNYSAGIGETYQKQADVPIATLSNPLSQYYNKLQLNLTPNGNPTDALYSIEMSPDGFTTVYYVTSSLTLTATPSFANFLSYSGWGGSTGIVVRGLARNTTYGARASAYRGKYTQSPYGPISTSATVNPSVTFEIDISATDQTTSPPYLVNFGSLLAATVNTSPVRVWISFDTNGEAGGNVYVAAHNGGLVSSVGSYTIPSSTGDLSSLSEGFGAQGASSTQASGGPFNVLSPYNNSGGNVGILDSSYRVIFSSSSPLSSGRASYYLLAKPQVMTPAAADYSEILTMVEAISF